MGPLPFCCSNDSQKCELKIMNAEEIEKKTKGKNVNWKT